MSEPARHPGRVPRVSSSGGPYNRVFVHAPTRVHWGLFNESGLGGRVDGGVGAALDQPAWRISMSLTPGRSVSTCALDEVRAALCKLQTRWSGPACAVNILSEVPPHIGLGSRSSLLMAIGKAYASAIDMDASTLELADILGRGGTSGVGIHLSTHGGIVIDQGHAYPQEKSSFGPSSSRLAPPAKLRTRYKPPEEWAVVHCRLGTGGISGPDEQAFFLQSCPVSDADTALIEQLVADTLIPSLERKAIELAHEFLYSIQDLGLKAAEWTIQDGATQALRRRWNVVRSKNSRLAPIALSSVGPTVFFLTDQPARELRELNALGVRSENITTSRIAQHGVRIKQSEVSLIESDRRATIRSQ
jgi:beta-ribofuranosylaminobenzene 5'-phosphate synthase